MSESDITLRRMAERYSDEEDYKRRLDLAMGVRHLPLCTEGECELCDAHRAREASNQDRDPASSRHGRDCGCTPCKAEDWDAIDAGLAASRPAKRLA